METETSMRPARGILILLGVGGILLGALVAAELVIPLQPPLGGGAPPPTPGVAAVSMPNDAASVGFTPKNITVILGVNNTILWTNLDTINHTVYSRSVPAGVLPFHSGLMAHGDIFEITLNVTGVYDYYCSIHPNTMKGTINVKPGVTVIIPANTANNHLDYLPANFTVVVGVNNTVTFFNQDSTTHTVTSDDGSTFNSGDIAAGKSWTFTFVRVGTFSFHCNYHKFMKGTITVLGPSSAA
jgi:plastocyanin